jgi:hypothetical protein
MLAVFTVAPVVMPLQRRKRPVKLRVLTATLEIPDCDCSSTHRSLIVRLSFAKLVVPPHRESLASAREITEMVPRF